MRTINSEKGWLLVAAFVALSACNGDTPSDGSPNANDNAGAGGMPSSSTGSSLGGFPGSSASANNGSSGMVSGSPIGAGGFGVSAAGGTAGDSSTGGTAGSSTGASGGAGMSGAGGFTTPTGRDFSTDRSKFLGQSRCAQANVQLCEDFESGMIDKNTWELNGGTLSVDGIQKARGNKALHISRAGNGSAYIRERKTFPAQNNTYYGRAFVYFQSIPKNGDKGYSHWTFIAASGTGVHGEIRISGQLQNKLNHFGVGTDDRPDAGGDAKGTGDWTNSDKDPNGNPKPVPTGDWACIEWMNKGDTNETRFWWDGVEHPSLYTSSTMHGGNKNPYILPQFNSVWIGWQEYQPSTETFEMWFDEIAIDKDRIGCVL